MMNWTQWNRYLYAGWAPIYDLLVCGLEAKRRISMDLANVQPGERVLLLGAGTGLDLKYIPSGAEITAVDITPGMISRLERRAKDLGLDVDARVMDGQALDFADQSFDVVILHFVLAVIPDPYKAVREAHRVLRPGGRAVILNKFVKDESEPSLLLRAMNQVVKPLLTDITCKLRPIVASSGMDQVYEKQVGVGGFFKIAILQKSGGHALTFEADKTKAPATGTNSTGRFKTTSQVAFAGGSNSDWERE